MKINILRKQIHSQSVDIFDAMGNPTGKTKRVLHIEFNLPDYPDLPTYGINIDFPIDKSKVQDALRTKLQVIQAQIEVDELVRQQLDSMGLTQLDIEV